MCVSSNKGVKGNQQFLQKLRSYYVRNMQKGCRALYRLGQVLLPHLSAPACFCPTLNQTKLVLPRACT